MKTRKAPKTTNPVHEHLTKAEQTANLLVQDLREAYAKSDPLVELVLFPLLEQAAKMEQALKSLNRAVRESPRVGSETSPR